MPDEVVKAAADEVVTEPTLDLSEAGLVFNPEEELPTHQYCVFRAGRERFCLPVLDVEEVVDWPTVTHVPLAPPFLMGIFNLRGSIVPIIDIAVSEGRRPEFMPKRVVVARIAGEESSMVQIGIAADEVIGTYTTTDQLMVEAAPKDVPHCCGMLRHDGRLALAIDLKKLVRVFPIPVI